MIEFFFDLLRKVAGALRRRQDRTGVQPRRFDREIDLEELDRRFDKEKARSEEILRKITGKKKRGRHGRELQC